MMAVAAMLTMMGLARMAPITSPWRALVSAANVSAAAKAKTTPPKFTARTNTMAVAPTSAPSENEMMLPLIVISVMPIATQPMKETVVISDRALGSERNPGVDNAVSASATTATARTAPSGLRQRANWLMTPALIPWDG